MKTYLVIGGMALITFLIRYTMFAAADRFSFPRWFEEALRFVPPTVLTAIIVPTVLFPEDAGSGPVLFSPQMAGALVALLVGIRTRNLLLVIFTGMSVFWLLRWFF